MNEKAVLLATIASRIYGSILDSYIKQYPEGFLTPRLRDYAQIEANEQALKILNQAEKDSE